jgi:DNA invertase Pin-like site-specific DNA recombinase
MNAAEMGRRGGRSRSAAKRAAARRNGERGGRPRDADVLARGVRDMCARLGPELPGVDPGDLRLIVRSLILPPARRAVFIARRNDGRYVF